MADSPFIVDVTRENYQQVMETSFKVPVLLDFWASWCQPCHMLMPTLAKLAEEYEGKFILGKLNTEEEQEIAAQFGIRSIPNVKLFRDGLPVDEFMGVLPESAVREFLERHVARESDTTVIEAREQMLSGNVDAAIARLTEAREADPDNLDARYQLAVALGRSVHDLDHLLDRVGGARMVDFEVTCKLKLQQQQEHRTEPGAPVCARAHDAGRCRCAAALSMDTLHVVVCIGPPAPACGPETLIPKTRICNARRPGGRTAGWRGQGSSSISTTMGSWSDERHGVAASNRPGSRPKSRL